MRSPAVTVLMPVYNGAAFLPESIRSVLAQTFTDFELLIVDDCSTDDSIAVIQTFTDSRIRLIRLPENIGVAGVRNIGLTEARGKYIAFLDCDDIALPERLQKQYAFLETHTDLGVVGGYAQTFPERSRVLTNPETPQEIKVSLLFDTPILNSTAMVRRVFLQTYALAYNADYKYFAEDYEFWQRLGEVCDLANMPEVLIKYRVLPASASRKNRERNREIMTGLYFAYFQRIGLPATAQEARLHDLIRYTGPKDFSDIRRLTTVQDWLEKIATWNERSKYYEHALLLRYLGKYWYESCTCAVGSGLALLGRYRSSCLARYYRPGWVRSLKLLLRVLYKQFV